MWEDNEIYGVLVKLRMRVFIFGYRVGRVFCFLVVGVFFFKCYKFLIRM